MPTDPAIQKQIEEFEQQKEKFDAEKQRLDSEKAVQDSQKALAQSQKDLTALNQLQEQKALADAQKALADSQKALLDSQRAADQAKSGITQQLADLQNQKSVDDAQKALADSKKALDQVTGSLAQQLSSLQNQKGVADAQKALADSQTQSLLARFIGEVKAGPFTGSVDLKDKAGMQEAALLAARAVQQAADIVAAAVPADVTDIAIFAAKDFPNFQKLLGFRLRKEFLKQAFQSAGIAPPAAVAETEVLPAAIPALVSGGLDALTKLLGFFKTDFTTGGIDVKLDESLLLFAVAGSLAAKNPRLPLIYNPGGIEKALSAVLAELAELAKLRSLAAKQAADPAVPAAKVALLNGAIALYDSFVNGLTTPDSSGMLPIALVAQEFSTIAGSQNGAILLLRLESAGGGFLVKKNIWTGLGSMPLFHSGGATVSYLLLNGSDGKVLKGDVVPVYGGFVASDDMEKTL
jgi:hypothetical protein